MMRGIAKWHVFIPNEAFLVAKSALGPHGANPPHTGRIGSRRHLAGGVPWGCSGGAQRSYGDHLHPIRLRFHGKPLF